MPHTEHLTREMRECADVSQQCAGICLETITHCMMLGGKHAEAAHIRIMADCAEICQTNANFVRRLSEYHNQISAVCAEVCRKCADDCARFPEDSAMQECANTCQRCAEVCERMGVRRAGG